LCRGWTEISRQPQHARSPSRRCRRDPPQRCGRGSTGCRLLRHRRYSGRIAFSPPLRVVWIWAPGSVRASSSVPGSRSLAVRTFNAKPTTSALQCARHCTDCRSWVVTCEDTRASPAPKHLSPARKRPTGNRRAAALRFAGRHCSTAVLTRGGSSPPSRGLRESVGSVGSRRGSGCRSRARVAGDRLGARSPTQVASGLTTGAR
jgi:hypothetical protein